MTTFDQREQGYEAGYAHDEEIEFKAAARRDRLLGLWAAERLGLSGDEATAYAASVVRADLQEPGDEDVFRKIMTDLDARSLGVSATEVRTRMDDLLAAAREDLRHGR